MIGEDKCVDTCVDTCVVQFSTSTCAASWSAVLPLALTLKEEVLFVLWVNNSPICWKGVKGIHVFIVDAGIILDLRLSDKKLHPEAPLMHMSVLQKSGCVAHEAPLMSVCSMQLCHIFKLDKDMCRCRYQHSYCTPVVLTNSHRSLERIRNHSSIKERS